MAIISSIGRRQFRSRLLIASIYTVLVLGALTMIYPFGLMLAGTTKSGMDVREQSLLPGFLVRDAALYQKHVEALFNESLEAMKNTYDIDVYAFDGVPLPVDVDTALVTQWHAFLDQADLPHHAGGLGYLGVRVSRQTMPLMIRSLKARLQARFDGDIEALNRELGTEFVGWNGFFVDPPQYLQRREKPSRIPFAVALRQFVAEQPRAYRYWFSPEGFYKTLFLKTQYTRKIEQYNAAHGTDHASWDAVHLTRRAPEGNAKAREDWLTFVRNTLNLFWVRADPAAAPLYHRFLKAKYGSIAALNERYGTNHARFEQVPLVAEVPDAGLVSSDWEAFLVGWKEPDTGRMYRLPDDLLYVHSVDFMFRDWLAGRFGGVAQINASLGTGFRDMLDIRPPQRAAHYLAFREMTGALRWEFVKRNFIAVVDYMVLHGRGLLNTVIYCALAVGAALLINPLAAYALSRYKMPSAYKVLLFLMLTMAFPPMVTQIPVFLMLRELGLLNTFWALILPGLANGYAIFLLKGFFDSQPRELYESAALDGAGEWVMFWQLTMNLSKPILAVIGLQAFTMAYSNFIFALLICQDEKMWTLMVWLYQLQNRSGPGVIYASLILAAIPTFLMFAFCQNIIMRGIVVPVEK